MQLSLLYSLLSLLHRLVLTQYTDQACTSRFPEGGHCSLESVSEWCDPDTPRCHSQGFSETTESQGQHCCRNCHDAGCSDLGEGWHCANTTTAETLAKNNITCRSDSNLCRSRHGRECLCCPPVNTCTDTGCHQAFGPDAVGQCVDVTHPDWMHLDLTLDLTTQPQSQGNKLCSKSKTDNHCCRCFKKKEDVCVDDGCTDAFEGNGICVNVKKDDLSFVDFSESKQGLCRHVNNDNCCTCFKKKDIVPCNQTYVILSSIGIAIDSTGSLSRSSKGVMALSNDVIGSLTQMGHTIPKWVLVTFNDRHNGSSPPSPEDIAQNTNLNIVTENVHMLRNALQAINFTGGGDKAERATQGIWVLLQNLPPHGIGLIFTDHSSKDLDMEEALTNLRDEKDIKLFVVLAPQYYSTVGDASWDFYKRLSEERLYNMKDFNVTNFLAEVVKVVGETCDVHACSHSCFSHGMEGVCVHKDHNPPPNYRITDGHCNGTSCFCWIPVNCDRDAVCEDSLHGQCVLQGETPPTGYRSSNHSCSKNCECWTPHCHSQKCENLNGTCLLPWQPVPDQHYESGLFCNKEQNCKCYLGKCADIECDNMDGICILPGDPVPQYYTDSGKFCNIELKCKCYIKAKTTIKIVFQDITTVSTNTTIISETATDKTTITTATMTTTERAKTTDTSNTTTAENGRLTTKSSTTTTTLTTLGTQSTKTTTLTTLGTRSTTTTTLTTLGTQSTATTTTTTLRTQSTTTPTITTLGAQSTTTTISSTISTTPLTTPTRKTCDTNIDCASEGGKCYDVSGAPPDNFTDYNIYCNSDLTCKCWIPSCTSPACDSLGGVCLLPWQTVPEHYLDYGKFCDPERKCKCYVKNTVSKCTQTNTCYTSGGTCHLPEDFRPEEETEINAKCENDCVCYGPITYKPPYVS